MTELFTGLLKYFPNPERNFNSLFPLELSHRTSKTRRHITEVTRNVHKPIVSSSQLIVEVSELHADLNGRLEITCLATIPAHVGPGEQFADYKTYSVKSE